MDDITELVDRVAALPGPCWRTDVKIAKALGLPWDYSQEWPGDMPRAYEYTKSIEAALTLVPQGWWWTVGDCSVSADASMGPDVAHCDKATLVRFDEGLHHDLPHPSTPAIALASLALRARAALGEDGR